MTVLHIAPTPFFSNRGCHIRIRNEIEALNSLNVKVILCTYHHGHSVSGIETRRIWKIPGYRKTDAGYSSFKFIADGLLFFLALKIMWGEQPCLLHGHLHEGALIGWIINKVFFWRKTPLIMDMQGSLTGELNAYRKFRSFSSILRVFSWVEKFVCRLPDYFVCSSEDSCHLLVRQFCIPKEKIMFVGDVVPSRFFSEQKPDELKEKHRIPKDKKIILYTGSLLSGKGIDHVLEAMRNLLGEYDDLFFILVGYPKKDVENYIQKHGLQDSCYVSGEIKYDDLPAWLSVGDIALEPKLNDSGEASGKLIHYMSAGLPIVCWDYPNNRSLLGESGYYVKPSSSEEYTKGIRNALFDFETAKLKDARSRAIAEENYSMKKAGLILKSIYEKLMR